MVYIPKLNLSSVETLRLPLYLSWSSELETGIPLIDNQHISIFSSINNLYTAIQLYEDQEIIVPIIDTVLAHTNLHLSFEERMLKEMNYSKYDSHVSFHENLIEKTLRLKYYYVNGDCMAEDFLNFLKSSWLYHVKNEDLKYVPEVKKLLQMD